ncbi:5-formyltetrahydrofolate cyclo-ligase [Desulfarculus baarsii DSM 2075]|uniref:5-formyltetrahydrofolate cyclo-ligase n=1 Tax=Desulfarculus baarsii (strain ATCC 33931 / DSM 2075 / LMG 7858 / VKM B-1802 / 2st14) TaxID=644282 RepID=E1QH06_DESB2|nr:5-formyltetrahydrofolate cyclo-ligase [Desulfarculus baarsii]ADK84849.1 5-formyltetrahydrofolate cyclo-ligase [Desulfarculus baarsii DSM 2075]
MNKDDLRQELGARWGALWPQTAVNDRAPLFPGAGKAAQRLRSLQEYRLARTIAVTPEPVLLQARINALQDGKSLLAATPGLKQGLVRLGPEMVPFGKRAKDLRGGALFGAGRPLRLPQDKPGRVDMLVCAAMAVDGRGRMLGDGRGLLDLFHAILRALGSLGDRAKVVVLVDTAQVVAELPQDPWDARADVIVTPDEVIRLEHGEARPNPGLDDLPPKLAALPLARAARGVIS